MNVVASSTSGSITTCPRSNLSKRVNRSLSNLVFSEVGHSSRFNLSLTRKERRRCENIDLYKEFIPYGKAWAWQKSIVKERMTLVEQNEDYSDTLIILQHPPVYTLGTGSSEEYLNFDIKKAPYDVYRTERGGEVTYHGPGQIVMYPIMNLRYHKTDLHWYLRALEEVIIRVLSSTFSIKGSRLDGLTGVWVGDEKLAAVGIRVSKWIAFHGLALNVTTDLTPFQQIVPCGISDRRVGSIKGLLSRSGTKDVHFMDDCQLMDISHKSLLKEFSEVFQVELHRKSIPMLEDSEKPLIFT